MAPAMLSVHGRTWRSTQRTDIPVEFVGRRSEFTKSKSSGINAIQVPRQMDRTDQMHPE